jgi:hypothetical protein
VIDLSGLPTILHTSGEASRQPIIGLVGSLQQKGPPSELPLCWSNRATTGLGKISGNNKHCVVVLSDTQKPPGVPQTLSRQHVCSTGGFSCLRNHELSGLGLWPGTLSRLPNGLCVDGEDRHKDWWFFRYFLWIKLPLSSWHGQSPAPYSSQCRTVRSFFLIYNGQPKNRLRAVFIIRNVSCAPLLPVSPQILQKNRNTWKKAHQEAM